MSGKTIAHILWNPAPHSGRVYGILDFSIFYHGGGEDHHIVQGTYVFQDYPNSDYIETVFGKISSDTIGVSGISLNRVGEIL